MFFPFASYSCIKETLGEKSSFSLPCTHLHFCRSRECLIAVSCLACLCAKSYKGVINLDCSCRCICVCLYWCEMENCGVFFVFWGEVGESCICLSKCVLMQWFPSIHTFSSLSAVCITSEYSVSSWNIMKFLDVCVQM